MSDFVLYPEDVEKLGSLLRQYIRDSGTLISFLTSRDGMLLSCEGATDAIDTVSVAALITGSFNATVTIANLIGEDEFTTLFHRGKNRHVHIESVDAERYLASVFENSTTVEKVGYCAKRIARELREYLQIMSGNADSAYLPDDESEAGQTEIDNVFEPLHESPIPAAPVIDEHDAPPDLPMPGEETRQEPARPSEESIKVPPKTAGIRVVIRPPSSNSFLRRKVREARAYQATQPHRSVD